MTPDPTIPFGYRRVHGQLQKGDGVSNGERFAKAKKEYPFVGLKQLIAIRRCEVVQTEIPGTEPAEKCSVCGGDEPCSHDFDKIAWPVQPQPIATVTEAVATEQGANLDE